MFSRTCRMLREFPVTWVMLFICPLLWVLDMALSVKLNLTFEEASRLLGGPDEIALWDGEWWRIITAGYHHGDIVHLLMNMSFLGVFGRLLETRLGSVRYFIFCLAALAVSGVCQSFSAPGVGLSGLGFAQFGLVWIFRRSDQWWRTQIPDELIYVGFIWFFACFVVDRLGLMAIGNVAHASGLVYGYLVGVTRFGTPRGRLWWPVLLSAHVFLLPCFYLVTHPLWNGRYHWRLAEMTRNPVEQIQHYENAVRCDPDLEGAWRNLAILHAQERDLKEAWRCILKGLARHPSSQESIEVARDIARFLIGPQNRARARQQLVETFGEHSDAWEKLLFNQLPLEELKPLTLPSGSGPKKHVLEPDAQIEEPALPELPTTLPKRALDEIPRQPSKLPAPDPDAPGGAEEGRAA